MGVNSLSGEEMQTGFKSQAMKVRHQLVTFFLRVRRLDREALASVYLSGSGIEIGALQYPLKVSRSAKVRHVDRMSVPDLRRQYPELKSRKLVSVDIIDDGETLNRIGDDSQDFVIANHFLEHCQNPIKAVINFVRVLREGGILYLSIPDKRYTFDEKREVTSFRHLFLDYTEGPDLSRSEHFRDWVVNVEQRRNEADIQRRVNELISTDYSIHYHVWTQKEMLDFFSQLNEQFHLPVEIQLFMMHGREAIFIIKKQSKNSS